MEKFKQGDIIRVDALNLIDTYINELHSAMLDDDTVKNLYETWNRIPTSADGTTNNIIDEIEKIKAEQDKYI